MKIIYVVVGLGKKRVSISEKICSQIRELNKLGISTTGYFFTREVSEKEYINDSIVGLPLKENKSRKYFNPFFQRQDDILQVLEILKKELPKDAIIYLRYPGSGYGFFSLLNEFGKQIVLFIPSNVIRENFIERKFTTGGSFGSKFFRWMEYFFFLYLQEKLFYRFHARKIRMLTTFTPEFSKMMKQQFSGNVTCVYNGDGTNTNIIPVRTPQNKGTKIKLLFMKGSAMAQYWSGLARLIDSIKNGYQDKFELYITGNTFGEKMYQEPFVKLVGKLSESELNQLCNEVDLGVSNLANYLIHFNETTNMKSREYYARGLPFIQSNTMPDITGKDAEKYFLCLPNDNSKIDMDLVVKFAHNMRADVNHPKEMRIFAESNLDWNIKMQELKEILETEFQEKLVK